MGHVHFLRRLIEWLYFYNREAEAKEWLQVAVDMYPTKMTYYPGYNPKTKTFSLDQIVFDKVRDDMQRGTDSKLQALMVGIFMKYFFYKADGKEEKANEYLNMAKRIHQNYTEKFKNSPGRMGIAPFDKWRDARLTAFLIEEKLVVANALRVQLGKPKDWLPEPPQTQPGPGR